MIIHEVMGEVLLNPLHKLKGSNGMSLYQNTAEKSLVVFVRHFGCIFCRETLKSVNKLQKNFKDDSVNLIVVHQSDITSGEQFLNKFGIENVIHFSDPDLHLYKLFELSDGRVRQLLGAEVWRGGVRALLKNKVIFGKKQGSVSQLGGFFLMEAGKVVKSHKSRNASDIPNLHQFISYCTPESSQLLNSA